MKLIHSLLLLLLFVSACNGQEKTGLQKDGGNTIINGNRGPDYNGAADIFRCGLRDKKGKLWFGTTGSGLYRYDGKSFIHFTEKDGLCNNYVCSILEDQAGNIWLGTRNGLCAYDGKNFKKIPLPAEAAAPAGAGLWSSTKTTAAYPDQQTVFALCQDKSGNIWLSIGASGVYRYDGTSFSHFLFPINQQEVKSHTIKCISQDHEGNLWFGSWSGGGVYCFPADRLNHPCNANRCKHNLQLAADLKIHNEERAQSVTNFGLKEGLTDDMISCILDDHAGNIWFGTRDHGVCRYNGKIFTGFSAKDGLPNCISTIAKDKTGHIWLGHDGQNGNEGMGISRYDGKTFARYARKDGLVNNNVFCIVEDASGNLWFGTRYGGLCRYDGQSFNSFAGNAE